MEYTHTSISTKHRPYSQLSQSSKIKDGGAWPTWWTWHPCVFLLTAPGSCHPNAVLPAFITCWTAQHVTGRASWRVTGLINLVWQLPDALSGSSPPSLSRSNIPGSRGPITSMIYSFENGERWGNALEVGLHFFSFFLLTQLDACQSE